MSIYSNNLPKNKDTWKRICSHYVNNRLSNSQSLHFGKAQKKYTPTFNSPSSNRRSLIFSNSKKRESPKQSQKNQQMSNKVSSLLFGFKELQIDSSFKANFRSSQRDKKTILKPSSFLKRQAGAHENSFLLNLSQSKLNISVIKNRTAQQFSIVKKQLMQSKKQIKALKKFINSQIGQFYYFLNGSFMTMKKKYQDKVNELFSIVEKLKSASAFSIPEDQSEIPEKTLFDSGDNQIEQLKNYLYPLRIKRFSSVNENQHQFQFGQPRKSVTYEPQKVNQQKFSQKKSQISRKNRKTSFITFQKMFSAIECIRNDLQDTVIIKEVKRNPMAELLQNFDSIRESQKSSLIYAQRNKNYSQNIFDELICKKSLRG